MTTPDRSRLLRFEGGLPRHPAVDAWLADQPDDLGAIARRWFDVVRRCGDDVRELLHDDQPTACVDEAAFAYVGVFTAHVNVGFFRGAGLPDPARVLQGTGKVMRHVKLLPGEAVDEAALAQLIAAAYADIKARLEPQPARRVTLRLMTERDLPMLHDWLTRPHVAEWWGDDDASVTLADVREHYRPSVLADEGVTPYIAVLDAEPIGYAQSYVALGSGGGWWPDETDPGVRGIDVFLSDAEHLGRGLGTLLVRAMVDRLFADPAVTRIQADPAPENARAIRCYQKAGFVPHGIITTPDGPALYMVLTRQAFAAPLGSAAAP